MTEIADGVVIQIDELHEGGAHDEDCISNLPTGVIGDILSLLPIKDAVRTCILSKEWISKWNLLFHVHIDANEFFPEPSIDDEVFVRFMERVLLCLENIRSFRLNLGRVATCCKEYEASRVITWLSSLSRHNIESLQLKIHCDPQMLCNHEFPILHQSILNSASLTYLVVEMPCTFEVSVYNCFSKLTRLYLKGVTIRNENSSTHSDTMTLNLPVLFFFELVQCKWLEVKYVEINAPSLIMFASLTAYFGDPVDYTIKIVGAKLKNLVMSFCHPENIILVGSTVSGAGLGFSHLAVSPEECGFQVRRLLRELSRVKVISLMGVLEAVSGTIEPPLSRFLELKALQACSPINAEALLEFLHAAPYLNTLHIELDDEDKHDYDYDYDVVESVPSCFASHLETVTLDYSQCDNPNMDLAKFVLKNGVRLKDVSVRGSPNFPDNEIIEQLLKFTKGSLGLEFKAF